MSSNNRAAATTRNRAMWEEQGRRPGEELEILENIHLAAICNDPVIRDALKSAELQQLIRNIDGSRARLEALAAAQHNIPQFDQFCQRLLSVIYGAEDSRQRRHY